MKRSLIPISASAPETAAAAAFREDQAGERSAEAAADRAAGGQVNGLVQLNLSLLVLDGDYRVFKIQ